MITERLARLDRPKRVSAAILVVLATTLVCYYATIRPFAVTLRKARAEYARVQTAYVGTEAQRASFQHVQEELEREETHLDELRQKWFGRAQAVQFFESMNTKALAYNVKPVSRAIANPKRVVAGKTTDLQPPLLETQSVKIVVAGDYGNIVDFLSNLTDCPQKVCIADLRIALPSADMSTPRASFTVAVLIDSSEDTAKK